MRLQSLPVVVVMAASLLGSVSATHPQTQAENCRYFVETGHYVCSEFREFFETRGELAIFGYPLTEAFDDPERGLRVQYFQRARMELHSYNPEPYTVQLGLLADELDYQFPPVSADQIPAFNNSLRHYFPETGHVVSYAFLEYFREKGDLDIFGYPRSEFVYEDGHIVQYFQRVRMEWHPEAISGPQMRLTNLGEIYVERFGVPGDLDAPRDPPARINEETPAETPDNLTKLNVSASVRHIITGRECRQIVFVYVTDQWQRAVQDAAITMTIHYPLKDQRYDFNPTDANGFTQRDFDILTSRPGQKVVIDVTVTHRDLTTTTQTFFLPWW